jgi:hypothetical protein
MGKGGGRGCRGHLPGDISLSAVGSAWCGSVDEVGGGSASGSCIAGNRGRGLGAHRHSQRRQGQAGGRGRGDVERSTRGRVSMDDSDEGVVSTNDGGTAHGGTVGVHGRWWHITRRRGQSPQTMVTRWRSPWTMMTQHAEAQSESTDDGGGAGVGSR